MSDTMTPEQRSRCMAAIHGKDTKPEVLVRKFLFAKGLRFRVCDRKLPGAPDIVLPKYKTVIFIDGCFWHGHEGCKYYQIPKTNTEFWKTKVRTNKARDIKNANALMTAGWNVIRIWECQVRKRTTREAVLNNLFEQITCNLPSCTPYVQPDDSLPLAAEPDPAYSSYRLSVIKSNTVQKENTSLTIIEWNET
ncbi:MAG: very short patch repair endonuclease [Bacteroides sp.]|nr:very short patch repair endonuclease [Bacteroides sp.]MCM1085066.1 very short patch repair endonuclease [Bacteroides sp.]